MIDIYTRTDCSFCSSAKQFMKSRNISYNEHLVGRDLTREELIEKFPQMKTVPIIVLDGRLIGGYMNLVEHYNGAQNDSK